MTYKFGTQKKQNTSFQKRERGFYVFGNSYFGSPIRNGLSWRVLLCKLLLSDFGVKIQIRTADVLVINSHRKQLFKVLSLNILGNFL